MNFDKATKHETLSRTEEANGLQFSLTIEVLPSNNLKIGSICQGCKYQVGKSVLLPVARSYNVWQQKMASNR